MLIPPLEWSARWLSARSSAKANGSNGTGRAARIQVRRFAGPTAYVQQMTPLRVAHLTDIHVGRVTPHAIQREAVDLTNAEHPDLVVITGDFVCHSQLYLDQLSEIVRGFRAPVIGVLGNHDYWAGADEVYSAGLGGFGVQGPGFRVRGSAIGPAGRPGL